MVRNLIEAVKQDGPFKLCNVTIFAAFALVTKVLCDRERSACCKPERSIK
jgi:hypothetical protein